MEATFGAFAIVAFEEEVFTEGGDGFSAGSVVVLFVVFFLRFIRVEAVSFFGLGLG